ncbi:hypothetical protein KUV75_01080 [Qipengyuania gaetbuli]|uniref:hypothetical protein n=1 Tax=Qipengyuania gaetbuli TaxID=266952 RepID=UPI001C9996DD|nr:hypothetical protein [Qipengyuania gaetbuli]MBY6013498.1 hypothetical protein [Qipengyuania gaetbuli]
MFQSKEGVLFRTGYRLAVANAAYCDAVKPSVGLLVHDARAYARPDAVRTTFGLAGDIGIQSVADGSPASLAGIGQNDTLLAIDGIDIAQIEAGERKDWVRASAIADQIEKSAKDGTVILEWRKPDGRVINLPLAAQTVCASRFELLSGKDGASADGERVLIGENFPGFTYSEPEFAALLAHEMAHNLLGHIPYLIERGNGGGRVRMTERDADRLMPWLLVNAGYDPAAAADFMRRWGPRHGGWIFRNRSHDGWDERVELIEAELPAIAAVTRDGRVDWRNHFRPLLDKSK